MTDIAEQIKAKVNEGRGLRSVEDPSFKLVRANLRGALIIAHRQLTHTWTEQDDQLLDVVTAWLEQLRTRSA